MEEKEENGVAVAMLNHDEMAKPKRRRVVGKQTVKTLKNNGLIISTVAGTVVGMCLGFGLQALQPSKDVLMWIGMPGELFLRSLEATIVPLTFSMIICCTAIVDPKINGKVAIVSIVHFFINHLIAAAIAVCLFFLFAPGSPDDSKSRQTLNTGMKTHDIFANLLRNLFPNNMIGAALWQTITTYKEKEQQVLTATPSNMNISSLMNNSSNTSITQREMERAITKTDGINVLGIIMVSTAIGIAANKVAGKDSIILRIFQEVQSIIFLIIRWVFWAGPVGVASLVAHSVAGATDTEGVFKTLGLLAASVAAGEAILLFFVFPAIVFVFKRENPLKYLLKAMRPFNLGFASTSSTMAIPEVYAACEALGVPRNVSSLFVPMSSALNACGSALFIATSALFLAQMSGTGVSIGNVLVIACLTSILALSIPGVPSASIVVLVIVLSSLNYPLDNVALLFAMEWLLDRLRSGVNCASNVFVAVVTATICHQNGHETAASEQVPRGQDQLL